MFATSSNGPAIPPPHLEIIPTQLWNAEFIAFPSITQREESDFPKPQKPLPTFPLAKPDVPISWKPVITESVIHDVCFQITSLFIPVLSTVPIFGRNGLWSKAHWFGSYEVGATTPSDGFAWYSSMVNGVGDWLLPLLNQTGDAYGHSLGQIMTHVFVYVFFMKC